MCLTRISLKRNHPLLISSNLQFSILYFRLFSQSSVPGRNGSLTLSLPFDYHFAEPAQSLTKGSVSAPFDFHFVFAQCPLRTEQDRRGNLQNCTTAQLMRRLPRRPPGCSPRQARDRRDDSKSRKSLLRGISVPNI